jgi:hypothetical protein
MTTASALIVGFLFGCIVRQLAVEAADRKARAAEKIARRRQYAIENRRLAESRYA